MESLILFNIANHLYKQPKPKNLKKVEPRAFNTYLYLTETSLIYGIIVYEEYIHRLLTLKELLAIDGKEMILDNDKDLAAGYDYEYWNDNEKNENNKQYDNFETEIIFNRSNLKSSKPDDKLIYQFILKTQGQFGGWKFHKYDLDDKPSVPHGHGLTLNNYKLDVYRGFIFDSNNGFKSYIGRETKRYIKTLWSNEKFRDLAIATLGNFISKNKTYNWVGIRRIKHTPLLIPKFK